MEKARTDRANNQAEDKVPAAKTASRPNRKIKEEDAAVVVPARVKAGVAVVDRDKVAVREAVAVAVAVKTVEHNPNKEGSIMPRLDRSGPMGAGPMTGGRRGLCGRAGAPADMPVYGGSYGRGMGFRRGYGRGRGYGFEPAYGAVPYPQAYGNRHPVSKTDEMEMLRANAEAMRQSLESVQRRIAELETDESQ